LLINGFSARHAGGAPIEQGQLHAHFPTTRRVPFIAAVEVATQFQHVDETGGLREAQLPSRLLCLQLGGLHIKPPGHGLTLDVRAVGQGHGQVRQPVGQLQHGQI